MSSLMCVPIFSNYGNSSMALFLADPAMITVMVAGVDMAATVDTGLVRVMAHL